MTSVEQIIDEPESRFYVKRWEASDRELSRIRRFIKRNRVKYDRQADVLTRGEARKLRKRLEGSS